ncbi:unnamed protein product [Musa acuminata subsp. malaccensis]|uniref:(wild Malaysian banana) hypothetical protein n=1 Tax=Musa acuminata subsp. malaccensis TaxID=214687 RepID=A0A8D7FFB5_MUSAM|nr:unnamed protein product [Musa acuminata subsp. malaccensis]
MNSKFPTPPPPISAFFFLLLLFSVPAISHPSNVACGEAISSCGNITNITYPFWLVHDDSTSLRSHCGYRGFELICRNNTPIIHLSAGNYTVTNIDYKTHTISLVDTDIVSVREGCPRVLHNLTFDPDSVLRYAPSDANLTFFFDCTDGPPDLHIPCLGSAGGNRSYVFTTETMRESYHRLPRTCCAVVVVPVLQDVLMAYIADDLPTRYGGVLQSGFNLSWPNVTSGDCGSCERSGGRCGLNRTINSTWDFACFCSNGVKTFHSHCASIHSQLHASTSSASSELCGKSQMHPSLRSPLPSILLLLALSSTPPSSSESYYRRSCGNSAQGVEAFLRQCGILAPKRYRYSEIKRMTKSFDDKLGQGGFGSVFKGALQDGRLVAVKVLKATKGHGGEEFINEVASISRTSHVNIVGLLGFCLEGSKRALVYDFMPNGSLEKFICSDKSTEEPRFGCEKLFEIALGVARGLEYLHGGCSTRIVHFDIKPHNILLDQDFCPKISDFGLAKLCPPKVSVISMADARGTVGYIAPEVFSRGFGVVSSKSDVYSYGMLLLEMAGGRRSIGATDENTSEVYFPHCLYDDLDRYCNVGAAGVTTETREVARKMMIVGLWCIQMMPENRPSMSEVVEMLKGSATDLRMPPRP